MGIPVLKIVILGGKLSVLGSPVAFYVAVKLAEP